MFRASRDPHDRQRAAEYLTDALAFVDSALTVYREGNATYDIGTAERLRTAILAEQAKARAP